jgi:hypothetical protein
MVFVLMDRTDLDRAATEEGFGLRRANQGRWLAFDALAAPVSIRLTSGYYGAAVAVNHAGVAADVAERWPRVSPVASLNVAAGFAAFIAEDEAALKRLLREIWTLARALPLEPLRKFLAEIRDLPRATESERLIVQQIGENLFREALIAYWGGRCAVTGVGDSRLLKASHIRPWARCASDGERLDVYNGLLLAAHLGAAFDAGLISFGDDGRLLVSPRFEQRDRDLMGVREGMALMRVVSHHRPNLAWHRESLFGDAGSGVG